jgi:hypothetical protein
VRAPVIIAAGAVVVLAGGAAFLFLSPEPAAPVAEAPRAVAPAPSPARVSTPAPAEPEAPVRRPAPRPEPAAPEPAPAPVEAAPVTGTLRIETDVPDASVFLDRVGVGTAPLTIPNVAPGSHRLNVSAAGYDGYAETIDVEPGARTITISFKEIRLNTSVPAQHKHGMGSCRGQLVASPEGIRYQAADGKDSFSVPFADLTGFDLDYLAKNLRLRTRQGRTFNFTEVDGNLDKLAYFQQDVEKVRKRLAAR